jgi:DNA-binding HxlR family transcriptional regulator
MTRTHEKVSHSPEGERIEYTPISAAQGVEQAFKLVEGRWKLVILFHLFGGKVMRFSDLERAIPTISQKMLAQQLRRLEADGIVQRTVHSQVPPKVEYRLTEWGQALCPALDALLKWAEARAEAGSRSQPDESASS